MTAAQRRSSMRDRFREHVREDVKEVALEQLAGGGPQAISLNAIARRLGVSGPALYRYYSNRDELLTELVIDAYRDLAAALAHAVADAGPGTGVGDSVGQCGGQVAIGVDHELGEQLVAVGVVAVQRRPGHPEPAGNGVERDRLGPATGQLLQGDLLHVLADMLTEPVPHRAPALCGGHDGPSRGCLGVVDVTASSNA